jgi:hypothetical protein
MSTYDEAFAADVDGLMDFAGESVTFTPLAGVARVISAIVHRRLPRRNDDNAKLFLANLDVSVANDGTNGISTSESGLIGGTLAIPERVGEAATNYTIQQHSIIDHDAVWIRLRF